MQNRSDFLGIVSVQYRLDDDCPVMLTANWEKSDEPIRNLQVHDCLEIGLCHSGSGVQIVGDKTLGYGIGDVTFIPRGEAHRSRSASGITSNWSWLLLDPIRMTAGHDPRLGDTSAFGGSSFLNVFSGPEHNGMRGLVERLIGEVGERRPHWQDAARALVCEILIHVRRTRPEGESRGRRHFDRLAPALQTIAERHAEPLRMADLAASCGLSEPHFRRLFTATLGQSPQRYLHHLRMQMASALLRGTERDVLDISLEVGFESLSSFNRLFRRSFGCSPTQWRKAAGGGETG